MRPLAVTLFRTLSVMAVSAMAAPTADAAMITTPAQTCMPRDYQPNFVDRTKVVYLDDGIFNFTDQIVVVCPVARSPLPPGAVTGAFWVDGDNFNGALTFGSVISYGWDGSYHGSMSSALSGPKYDVMWQLPAAMLGSYDYVVIEITLPKQQGGIPQGKFRGYASVQ